MARRRPHTRLADVLRDTSVDYRFHLDHHTLHQGEAILYATAR